MTAGAGVGWMDGSRWAMGAQERARGERQHGCWLSLGQEQPWQSHLPSSAGKGTQQPTTCAEALGNDLPSVLASGGTSMACTAFLRQRDLIDKSTFGLD